MFCDGFLSTTVHTEIIFLWIFEGPNKAKMIRHHTVAIHLELFMHVINHLHTLYYTTPYNNSEDTENSPLPQ